jgi:FkbM family methyltransferase
MVGLLMRLYRASPLHPRLGAVLARLLGLATALVPGPRIRVVRGIRWELDLGEVIDASLYFSGSFEPRAERVIARHLGPGMVAIDVGANIGYHALPMALQVGPTGRVVAVEPSPATASRLRRNLVLNDLDNVEILVAAVGDRDVEAARLHVQSSYPLSGRGGRESLLARLVRLDSLVLEKQLHRVDFVKIDVDGQEAKVLRGARETLRRFRPPVFFELTPSLVEDGGDSLDELFASLLDLGYAISDEGGADWPSPVERARRLRRGSGCNLLASPSSDGSQRPVGAGGAAAARVSAD